MTDGGCSMLAEEESGREMQPVGVVSRAWLTHRRQDSSAMVAWERGVRRVYRLVLWCEKKREGERTKGKVCRLPMRERKEKRRKVFGCGTGRERS